MKRLLGALLASSALFAAPAMAFGPVSNPPAFADLSGSATCAQLPALTGDATTSPGTCGTSVVKLDGQISLSYASSTGFTATLTPGITASANTNTYGTDYLYTLNSVGSTVTKPITAGLVDLYTAGGFNFSNYGSPTTGDMLAAYFTLQLGDAGTATSGTLAASKGIEVNANTIGGSTFTLTDNRQYYSNLDFEGTAATITSDTVYGFGMTGQHGTLTQLNGFICPSLTGSFTIGTYHCLENLDSSADMVNAGPFKQQGVLRESVATVFNGVANEIDIEGTVTQPTVASPGATISIDTNNGLNMTAAGPTFDFIWHNSAGTTVMDIAHATTNLTVIGNATAATFKPSGALSGTSLYQPAANQLGLSTNNTKKLVVDTNGNISYYGTAPAVSSCGTAAVTANSTNDFGQVNITAGAPATCTITFANSGYGTYVFCVVTDESALTTPGYSYTTTVLTLTATALSGKVDWACTGI